MGLIIISISDIERVMNKSINTLIDNFKSLSSNQEGGRWDNLTDVNFGGWHQFLFEKKIGAVATSQGISCFSYTQKNFTKISSAINLLKKEQCKNGGFTIKTLGEFPLVESTSWVVLGIRNNESEIAKEIIDGGVNWIANNKNDDNGWGSIKGTVSRIYATDLALLALSSSKNNEYQTLINNGIEWLKNARNADGCWGELSNDDKSTPFHTAFTVFVLRQLGLAVDASIISSSLKWLDGEWDKKTMWEKHTEISNIVEHYDLEIGQSEWRRVFWNHFVTPWVVVALLDCDILNHKVFKSIDWLIKNQNEDGCWKHQNVNKSTIWTIHDALFCLKSFLNQITIIDNYNSVELHDDSLVLKGEFDLVRKIKRVIYLAFIFTKRHWAGVFMFSYLLVGGILSYAQILDTQSYILGLIFPTLLLIIDWMAGKTVAIIS